MTYDERVNEIKKNLDSGSPIHARAKLNYLIRDLGYVEEPKVFYPKRIHRVLLPNELRSFIRSAKKEKRFSLEFAFNTGLMPLELIRVSRNLRTLFNEDECSIKIPSKNRDDNGSRTIFLTETFSDRLAVNLESVEFPMETITQKRLRVVVPKYQAWLQWYKRLARKSGIEHPEDIRMSTNRYTWAYYLFTSGVAPSVISEQLRLTRDVEFYKSFTVCHEPNVEDIEKYTHDWKGNL